MDFKTMQAASAARIRSQREGRSPEYRAKNAKASPCYSRKVKAKLDLRLADYAAMIGRPDFKQPDGAYHRPGSGK